MRKLGLRLVLLACAALALAFVTACGGDDEEEGGGGGGGGKTGGSIRIGTVGPDSYDPALVLTTQAVQVIHLVWTPLLTFKDEEGDAGGEVIPGLAEAMPEISADGKTYKLKVRSGIKYSDGTPVKASDFEHMVRRVLKLGGPFGSFLTNIGGAAEFQEKGDFKADISGITSDDETGDITIKLNQKDSQFPFILALPDFGLMPASKAPPKSLTKDPPPGYGSYTLEVVDPSREYILTKNKQFDIPGMEKGKVDKITGVVSDSVPRMTQDVIDGKLDFMTEDPTGDLLPLVRTKYKDRFRLDPVPLNTYWYFMNFTTPPFDKKEARQAVNYALDEQALVRIFGGRLKPGCNFLPEGMVGYKKIDPCPYGDPNGEPDIEKAKQLVEQSGTKGMEVTVWGNNKDPRPAIVEYMRDLLNQIGYKAKTKILDQQVYFNTIGLEKTKAQIGFTDWFQDFPHPADFFGPNLSGESLKSSPTFNFSFNADPVIDKALKDLTPEDPKDVADEWAEVDRHVVENATNVMYGSEQASTFFSERMDFENCSGTHVVYKNDWTLLCLK
jgi:peptide/nickel transport system substrate-binding protein